MVALELAVNGNRLRLYAADGTQHQNSAVQHAQ